MSSRNEDNQELNLRIETYFSGLRHELNCLFESLMSENERDFELVTRLKLVRGDYFKETLECEAENKRRLESLQNSSNMANEDLFVAFCFLVSIDRHRMLTLVHQESIIDLIGLRLVRVDKYLNRDQIYCFQEMLKFTPCFYYQTKEKEKETFFVVKTKVGFYKTPFLENFKHE